MPRGIARTLSRLAGAIGVGFVAALAWCLSWGWPMRFGGAELGIALGLATPSFVLTGLLERRGVAAGWRNAAAVALGAGWMVLASVLDSSLSEFQGIPTTFASGVLCASAGGHVMLLTIPYRRRLRATDCPNCGYDLRGTPGADRCPECGRSPRRTTPTARRRWMDALPLLIGGAMIALVTIIGGGALWRVPVIPTALILCVLLALCAWATVSRRDPA